MAKQQGKDFSIRMIDHMYYDLIPSFSEVFDEDSFYIFVAGFVTTTLLTVFILSRFITLRPVDW